MVPEEREMIMYLRMAERHQREQSMQVGSQNWLPVWSVLAQKWLSSIVLQQTGYGEAGIELWLSINAEFW
jgi:hypothetical protein